MNLNFLKDNKGVTLVTMIMVIIVITIIASVSIVGGNEIMKSAKESKAKENQTAVEAIINSIYIKQNTAGVFTPANSSYYGTPAFGVVSGDVNLNGWYLIDEDDLNEMGIDYIEESYLVNYQANQVVSLNEYLTTGKLGDTVNIANEENDSSMELSYQYGYVIVKFNNAKMEQAYVKEMQQDTALVEDIGLFETFDEYCNKTGEDSEEKLRDVCYDSISTSDADYTEIWDSSGTATMIYMTPYADGEVKIENTLTSETKSIEISEMDEYMVEFRRGGAEFRLCQRNGEKYELVDEAYDFTLGVNGVLKYSGTVYDNDFFYTKYASDVEWGDIAYLDICVTINNKTIYFKGNLRYSPK